MTETFGEYIKRIRKDRGMTIREVARKTGISNSYLSQLERGKRGLPSHEFIVRLSGAYGVSPGQISNKAIGETKGIASLAKESLKAELEDCGVTPPPDLLFIRKYYLQLTPESRKYLTKFLEFLYKEERKPHKGKGS